MYWLYLIRECEWILQTQNSYVMWADTSRSKDKSIIETSLLLITRKYFLKRDKIQYLQSFMPKLFIAHEIIG